MSTPEIEPEKCEGCGKPVDSRWCDMRFCRSCRNKEMEDMHKSNENPYGTD